MPNERTEQLLNDIGQILAEDTEYPLDRTLLYAKLAKNMVSAAIFKDRGKDILYRHPDLDHLGDALLDLWEAEDPANRWAEIEYVIRGDRFETTFAYREEIDPEEDPFARRDRIVARHFGDKPIVYPPMSPHLEPFKL